MELLNVFHLTVNNKEVYSTDEKDIVVSIRSELQKLKVGYALQGLAIGKETLSLEEYKTKKHSL